MKAIKFVFGDLELTNEVINRLAQLGYTPESLKKAIKAHEWKYPSDEPALYCGTQRTQSNRTTHTASHSTNLCEISRPQRNQ